jgi:hypothetical protein
MAKFGGAFVVAVLATPLLVSGADAKPIGRLILLDCVGMELSQNADGDNAAPDDNSQPDSGAPDDNAQSPGDDGAADGGDGADQDQASPPDSAQPPGCIFQKGPLELIV